ncbi:MAG: FapA family protein [Phycisphaeraceae bacterium]
MASDRDISPYVVIADDKMSARLVIPAGCDLSAYDEQTLLGLIRGEGVEVSDFTTQAVREFLAKALSEPADGEATDAAGDITFDIAHGQLPVNGGDGRVEWLVDAPKDAQAPSENDSVSFYDRCAFVMVHAGNVIGKVHAATLGQDGRDVTGATLPAKSGKDPVLKIDESILKKADGSLVAQQDGVLYREPGKAQIRKRIEIREYVDFSTGNIDFDGDISIARGVRDCFVVKATGNVEVKGLIEAATIETGKDLYALGGFAGRERGHAKIGGTLFGKYLDNVQGHVKQDLCVDREVINCELVIDGEINMPRGSIIGGCITPTGKVEIGCLGSSGAVVTELVIGTVPTLQPFADKLENIIDKLTHDRDKLVEERDLIDKMSGKGRMTATDKERQTEIMFELSSIESSLNKAQRTFDNVQQKIAERRQVDITVHQQVHPGVTFILDGCRYKVYDDLKGPIRFFIKGKGFVCQQGNAEPKPVNAVTDVTMMKSRKNAA